MVGQGSRLLVQYSNLIELLRFLGVFPVPFVLFYLPEHTITDNQQLDVGSHETPESILRCADGGRCGIHDSNASYLCYRVGRPAGQPFAVVSSGTWTVIMAHGSDLARLRENRDMLANVDAFGVPVATARFTG